MLLGQHNVGVYDGSMSEWASDPARPLKIGTEP
jgi:3-mercaptopyruvate sulfurtransferase SseA